MVDAMLFSHVRMAWRLAARRPALSLLRIATVSLVIAAGSAVLTVASATLLRPLPFPDDARLLRVNMMPPGIRDFAQANPLHPLEFLRLRERLTRVGAFEGLWARERALTGDGEPESVPAASVSAGFFAILGGAPVAGRTFTEKEVRDGARLVVLSHQLWTRRFGGSRAALGRPLQIDREAYEIVGVMQPRFDSAYVKAELWTPLEVREGRLILPGATFIQTLARLRRDADQDQFRAELAQQLDIVRQESPDTLNGWTIAARSLRSAQFGEQHTALKLLLAAVMALSLVAAANLGNLTLADVLQRRGELAVRAALGATRLDLVWPELMQSALLAAAGGAAGLAAGSWILPMLVSLDPTNELASAGLRVDWRVLAGTGALAGLIMAAAAILPTLGAARQNPASTLMESSRRTAGGAHAERLRAWLVAAQTALALVLLVTGALLAGAFDSTLQTQPGFDPRGVLTAQLRLPEAVYDTADKRAAFAAAVLDRVRSVPGVVDASTTMNLFIPGFAFQTLVYVDGQPTPDGQPHTVQFRRTGHGYFRTMRIRMIGGREFDNRDASTSAAVAVVSRSFAVRFWQDREAVGRRIRRTAAAAPWMTIVGVVDDVRDVGFGQAAHATVYTPYAQNNSVANPISLVVRTGLRDPLGAIPAVKAAVWAVDSTQPLASVGTLEGFLRDSLGPQRFRTVLLNLLAAVGLLLAAVGTYGVTARTIAERTREAGIRLALGAVPSQVWRTLVAAPLRAFASGAGVGAGAAVITAATLTKLFPEIGRGGLLYVTGATLALLACGAASAMLAARTVARLDPAAALRRD